MLVLKYLDHTHGSCSLHCSKMGLSREPLCSWGIDLGFEGYMGFPKAEMGEGVDECLPEWVRKWQQAKLGGEKGEPVSRDEKQTPRFPWRDQSGIPALCLVPRSYPCGWTALLQLGFRNIKWLKRALSTG